MPNYVCYKIDTGEITCTGSASNEENCYIQMEDVLNEHVLIGFTADDSIQYIKDGAIIDRPIFNIDEDLEITFGTAMTFNLPEGTEIIYDRQKIILNDGVLELEGMVKSTYNLRLSLFPYQEKTVNIRVK